MAVREISLPPIIDANGEIDLHGRAGVAIPVIRQDSDGNAVAIPAEAPVFFEIDGQLRKALDADPDNADGRLLVITDAECAALPLKQRFAAIVRDETADPAAILYEGWVRTHGYSAEPA